MPPRPDGRSASSARSRSTSSRRRRFSASSSATRLFATGAAFLAGRRVAFRLGAGRLPAVFVFLLANLRAFRWAMLPSALLSRLHVERLRSLLTRPRLELDLVALAKLLELDARAETRAMEEDVVRPVIRRDEAEALVAHDALDRPGHGFPLVGRLLATAWHLWQAPLPGAARPIPSAHLVTAVVSRGAGRSVSVSVRRRRRG